MARETLHVPEEHLLEVVDIIRAGLRARRGGGTPEVHEQLEKWCDEGEEYLRRGAEPEPEPEPAPAEVTRVEFVVYVGGRKCEAIFIRRKKVADLLADPGSLGEFLRDFVAGTAPDPAVAEPDLEKSGPEDVSDTELDELFDWPPIREAVATVPEVVATVKKQLQETMVGYPLTSRKTPSDNLVVAMSALVMAAYVSLDEGLDEFALLRAARAAFKKVRELRETRRGAGH